MTQTRRSLFKRKRVLIPSIILGVLLVVGVVTLIRAQAMKRHAVKHASTGKAAISLFGELSRSLKSLDLDAVMANYDPAYRTTTGALWVEDTAEAREDGVIVSLWRGEDGDLDFAGVQQWWGTYLDQFASVQLTKFKLTALKDIGDGGATPSTVTATLWVRGMRKTGETFESQVKFLLELSGPLDQPRILSQALLSGNTVMGPGKGFTNITEETGITFKSVINPDFSNDPEWDLKVFGIAKYSSAGVTTTDYNDDGWYDIFFSNGGEAALYRNNGDGSYTDVTAEVNLSGISGSNSVLFLDLDNDGDKDLFTSGFTSTPRVFRNDDGLFTEVTNGRRIAGELVVVSGAADYDNDGDLDIYLGRYLDPRKDLPTTIFYTRNGAGNSLLRNDGNFGFTEVTDVAGVAEGGLTLGVAWADYDRDGDPDLYVANDFGRNAFFRNNGDGTFKDISWDNGTTDLGYGMSASWGDANNDGHLDIYVANVHSSNRWYGQAPILYNYVLTSIKQGTIWEDMPAYQDIYRILGMNWTEAGDHLIKGNSLLINDGEGNFTDVSEDAGSNPFGWYWGSTFVDYDNDGRQDLYTVNGFVSGTVTDDL